MAMVSVDTSSYPVKLAYNPGASTEVEMDETCVQIGSRGERITPSRGEEFPEIYGSY